MLFNKSTHLFEEYSQEGDSLKTAKNIKAGAGGNKEEAIMALMKELKLTRNEALQLYSEVEQDGKGKLVPDDDPTPE
jgi:acyl-CoA hydrolase